MRSQQDFYEFLVELQLIQAQIVLKLPASQESIQQQVQQIRQAQQALDRLHTLTLRSVNHRKLPLHHSPHLPVRLIHQTARYAESLKLLAEEFPVDPQGTVACLQQLCRRHLHLHEKLQQLMQRAA